MHLIKIMYEFIFHSGHFNVGFFVMSTSTTVSKRYQVFEMHKGIENCIMRLQLVATSSKPDLQDHHLGIALN